MLGFPRKKMIYVDAVRKIFTHFYPETNFFAQGLFTAGRFPAKSVLKFINSYCLYFVILYNYTSVFILLGLSIIIDIFFHIVHSG